jgi:hypothetical protein
MAFSSFESMKGNRRIAPNMRSEMPMAQPLARLECVREHLCSRAERVRENRRFAPNMLSQMPMAQPLARLERVREHLCSRTERVRENRRFAPNMLSQMPMAQPLARLERVREHLCSRTERRSSSRDAARRPRGAERLSVPTPSPAVLGGTPRTARCVYSSSSSTTDPQVRGGSMMVTDEARARRHSARAALVSSPVASTASPRNKREYTCPSTLGPAVIGAALSPATRMAT